MVNLFSQLCDTYPLFAFMVCPPIKHNYRRYSARYDMNLGEIFIAWIDK